VAYDFDMILGAVVGADTLKLHSSTEMVIFGLDNVTP
jgi:hypothetical protein